MPRPLTPEGRRRHRWLARCLVAVAGAPDAYRLSVMDLARRLSDGDLDPIAADALADTLGGLLLDTLNCTPTEET
jgi:hypothetical protein